MAGIHGPGQILKNHAVRSVQVHADLLVDNAPLLFYAFLCEIGSADKFQQKAQALLKMVRAGEIIGGHVVACKGIAACPQGRKLCADIPAVGQIEHFVLQIVGNAGRDPVRLALKPEMGVDGAKVRDEIGLLFGKARFFHHFQGQTIGQDPAVDLFVQSGVVIHRHPPVRKQLLCSRTVFAQRTRSSLVTASRAARWAWGSSALPPRRMAE